MPKKVAFSMSLFAFVVALGCATTPEPAANTAEPAEPAPKSQETSSAEATMKTAAWPSDVEIYKDAEGNVVCAVMGSKIDSPDKAVGYQDYEGKRYYFCCGGCPESFKKDPAKYAAK